MDDRASKELKEATEAAKEAIEAAIARGLRRHCHSFGSTRDELDAAVLEVLRYNQPCTLEWVEKPHEYMTGYRAIYWITKKA